MEKFTLAILVQFLKLPDKHLKAVSTVEVWITEI